MLQFLLEFLVQNTIWSFLTCSLVVCAALTLKRSPAVVHLVCVLALVGMLTPPLFSVAFPGSNWIAGYRQTAGVGTDSSDAMKAGSSPVLSHSPRRSPQFSADTHEAESRSFEDGLGAPTQGIEPSKTKIDVLSNDLAAAGMGTDSSSTSSLVSPPQRSAAPWPIVLGVTWAIGSLLYLAVILRQFQGLGNLIAKAKPARKSLVTVVNRESKRIGIHRSPCVLEIDGNFSPFVFLSGQGIKLVMPTALMEGLADEELRSLLLHELVHVKRRDPVIRFFELIVTTIFWFNPAVWVIRHQLRHSEELACDAVVTDTLKDRPEVYAGAFLKTIDFLSADSVQRPSSWICTVGGYRFCTRRIRAMIQASNHVGITRMQGIITAAVAIPLLVAGFLTANGADVPNAETSISRNTETSESTPANEDELTTLDLQVIKELSAVKETPNIVFHYRSADIDGEALAQIVKTNLEKYQQCESLLKMKYEGRVHIFLYRDVADLQKTTGVEASAFATGKVSVHQPIEFNSVHELTHIFALQFPKDEDAVTDEFVVEGLATILAEHDQDIPIHSWAAVYQSESRLPDLVALRRSWPDGVPPGVHPYHVAGSFVGYLIEEFGIETVKRWYVHSTEAHMEFGKTFRRLERDWHRWLERKTVSPKERELVLAKIGMIPDKYASAKTTTLFNGESLTGLTSEDAADWNVEDGRLIGSNQSTWSFIGTEREYPISVGVKVKFRLVEGKAVAILLNRTDGSKSHVNFATWASYMSLTNGAYVVLEHLKIKPGEWNEVVVVNENGTGKLYFNGLVIHQQEGAFFLNEGGLGLGVESGTIEVETFEAIDVSTPK